MLQGEHITVRYGSFTVVNDLSFHLKEGQWLMLAGPNGAGKSTLIEAIAQGAPHSGTIRWKDSKASAISWTQNQPMSGMDI